jgi:hypothetical protein
VAVRFERFRGSRLGIFSQILPYRYGKDCLNPNVRTRNEPLAAKSTLMSRCLVRPDSATLCSATCHLNLLLTWAASEACALIGSAAPFHQDMQRGDARSRHKRVSPRQWPCFWHVSQAKCRRKVTFWCFLLQRVGVISLLEGLGFVFTTAPALG